jgi:hypothetical protein
MYVSTAHDNFTKTHKFHLTFECENKYDAVEYTQLDRDGAKHLVGREPK